MKSIFYSTKAKKDLKKYRGNSEKMQKLYRGCYICLPII